MEKALSAQEFLGGLLAAGVSGMLLFWGNVSANRTSIDVIKSDVAEIQSALREVSEDTSFMRGQMEIVTSTLLENEQDNE